jgi:hypothetical protein
MKHKVYLETSIVSYYTARPSRDLVVAAWQEVTHEIWPTLRSNYDIYISALVIQEASRGDKGAAENRLNALSGIPVLEITHDAQELANILMTSGAIPETSEEDALHIAIASLNGMEFLLTWNFSHINNAFKKSKITQSIENHGLIPPEICSPEEFIGD